MNWITAQLALMSEPAHIVHIGAGQCRDLDDYCNTRAANITLIEPNPEKAAALKQRAGGLGNVTVIEAAVAEQDGTADLYVFNFPDVDSLYPPTNLGRILPGLRQVGRTNVSTLSVEKLIGQLALDQASHNWLIVEAGGAELGIIDALHEHDALRHFTRLIVRTGAEPFYETGSWAGPLLKRLEAHGYRTEGAADNADADWPRFYLRLDHMALECARLETELAEAQQAREQAEERHQARIAELEADVATQREEAEELAGELQSARAAIDKQARTHSLRIQELETTLAEKECASNDLSKKLRERDQKMQTMEKKNEDLQLQYRKMEQEYHRREALIDEEFLKAESQLELIKELVFKDRLG